MPPPPHRLQTQHTVFLGRILVTMACMFPLTDRSGVNLQARSMMGDGKTVSRNSLPSYPLVLPGHLQL